jgi:DNA-binding HxlR family transcriptional regulator
MHTFNEKEYPCRSTLTMGIIGGKWKTAILYNLKSCTLRYNELRKLMPTVTERTLSLQLKALEADGIVKRKVYTSKPPLKVEYSLSEFGETLVPLLDAIVDWANYVIDHKAE